MDIVLSGESNFHIRTFGSQAVIIIMNADRRMVFLKKVVFMVLD